MKVGTKNAIIYQIYRTLPLIENSCKAALQILKNTQQTTEGTKLTAKMESDIEKAKGIIKAVDTWMDSEMPKVMNNAFQGVLTQFLGISALNLASAFTPAQFRIAGDLGFAQMLLWYGGSKKLLDTTNNMHDSILRNRTTAENARRAGMRFAGSAIEEPFSHATTEVNIGIHQNLAKIVSEHNEIAAQFITQQDPSLIRGAIMATASLIVSYAKSQGNIGWKTSMATHGAMFVADAAFVYTRTVCASLEDTLQVNAGTFECLQTIAHKSLIELTSKIQQSFVEFSHDEFLGKCSSTHCSLRILPEMNLTHESSKVSNAMGQFIAEVSSANRIVFRGTDLQPLSYVDPWA